MSFERVFPSDATSVRAARNFVRECVEDSFEDDKLSDIALATSELATNAVEHGDGDDFNVSVFQSSDRFTVRVTSVGESSVPHLRDPTPDRLNGRGLRIATAVSDDLQIVTNATGATVSCVFLVL